MLKKDLTEEKFKEMLEKSYMFTVSDAVGERWFRQLLLNTSDFTFFDDWNEGELFHATYHYFLSQNIPEDAVVKFYKLVEVEE